MSYAKGAVLRATLDFIAHDQGPEILERVLDRLPQTTRTRIAGATATDEVPLPLAYALWHAVEEVIGTVDPGWVERAGAHSIDSLGMQLYGGIVRKPSPLEFLAQRISLFRLFYRSGQMEVVETEEGYAVLRLVDFEPLDRLFCRRQTGGLRRVLDLAGGGEPVVRHVRCALDGDAFCEWELRWS